MLALVASLSGPAFAEEAEPAPADPPGEAARPQRAPGFPAGLAEARLIREMPEEIGVSEETLGKLEKLVAEIRAEEEALHDESLEARNVVQALLDQPRPDEKELMAAVGASSGVARKTREHRVMASLRIRALLTDEQLVKLMELRRKAMGKRRKGGRPRVRR